jgi:hypothetical protein
MADKNKEDARSFLEGSLIPQVVRSIICGLMVERPDDHMGYIQDKLQVIKEKGRSAVDWESFVYNVHPYRDPQRLDLIHDFSKYYLEHLEKQKEREMLEERTKSSLYEPDVFKLTETAEESANDTE